LLFHVLLINTNVRAATRLATIQRRWICNHGKHCIRISNTLSARQPWLMFNLPSSIQFLRTRHEEALLLYRSCIRSFWNDETWVQQQHQLAAAVKLLWNVLGRKHN